MPLHERQERSCEVDQDKFGWPGFRSPRPCSCSVLLFAPGCQVPASSHFYMFFPNSGKWDLAAVTEAEFQKAAGLSASAWSCLSVGAASVCRIYSTYRQMWGLTITIIPGLRMGPSGQVYIAHLCISAREPAWVGWPLAVCGPL